MDQDTVEFKRVAIVHGINKITKRTGRIPKVFELDGNLTRKYSNYREIIEYFGSWHDMLVKARIVDYYEKRTFEDCHDREGCAYWLHEWADEIGRMPQPEEAKQLVFRGYNLYDECEIRFGSWAEALEAAGLT